MMLDLLSCSLEELYKMQEGVEGRLEKHRVQEPSTKRAHSREHEVWVLISHGYIEELHRIRDAIIEKKAKRTQKEAE